ncbi:DNRLRE domain-containing protein [Solibaculum mannosilyticum]|uniref:DNRLRE domain-containing protein n=1 Tax=Solibaculum mannosilyticum TaxID=2780922 RepID=UPI001C0009CA|nr:DNRLRE domain-containing protein [Solibaculum mannosilyticum]
MHVNGEIVLNNVPEEDCYILNLDTKGLPARLNEDKSITVYDPETGEEEFYIKAPFMYDENLEECHNIGVELVETEIGYDVILTLDKEWISSPDRVGSLLLDYEISNSSQSTSNIDDTYVHPGDYAKQHWGEISWKVGVQNGQVYRAFLKIRKLPELPAGYCLEDPNSDQDEHSYLHLTLVNGTTTTINIQEYGIDSDWSPDTITWDKHNNMNYTYYGDSFAFGVERHQIWVHDQPERYYTEKGKYHGLMFKSTDETYQDWNQMYSGNYSGASSRPYIEVHYTVRGKPYLYYSGHMLYGDIKNVSYYIHSSINSANTTAIVNAINSWQYILQNNSVNVNFYRVYSSAGATVSFFDRSYAFENPPGSSESANTQLFIKLATGNTKRVSASESSWDYANIFLNQSYISNRMDHFDTQGTMAHEFGHALGLQHMDYPYALMTQWDNGFRKVYYPQGADIIGVKKLYGYL